MTLKPFYFSDHSEKDSHLTKNYAHEKYRGFRYTPPPKKNLVIDYSESSERTQEVGKK